VDSAIPVPTTVLSPPPQRSPGAGKLLSLVNGVLTGAGTVYVTTRSVLVTVTATIMAIGLAWIVLVFQR
jgi:hypothetical protein